jgi:hypothetical protein
MSRSLVSLLALVTILATGCGEVGLPVMAGSVPAATFTDTSSAQHQAAIDSFADVVGLGLVDAVVLVGSSSQGSIQVALDGLTEVELAQVAVALAAHDIQGVDLDAQLEAALDDRLIVREVDLPQGPGTWLLWTAAGVARGALFEAGSAVQIGTVHKYL